MHLKNVLTRLTLDKLTRSLNERPDRPQTGVWMLLQQGQDQSNKEISFGQPNSAEGQTSRHTTIAFHCKRMHFDDSARRKWEL